MRTKAFPNPVSNRALQKMYQELAQETEGHIDISTEAGAERSALLRRYIAASSNLYGVASLQEVWEQFAKSEPTLVKQRKIRKKDFVKFTEILRVQDLPYYILNWDEIYAEVDSCKPIDRLVVNKKLVSVGVRRLWDVHTIIHEQKKVPAIMLDREEYLAWAEGSQFWETVYARKMKMFLENLCVAENSQNCDIDGKPIHGKSLSSFIFWSERDKKSYKVGGTTKQKKNFFFEQYQVMESEKLMQRLEQYLNLGEAEYPYTNILEWLLNALGEVGVELTKKQIDTLIDLFVDLNNHSRLWFISAWTPAMLVEVMQKIQSDTEE